MAETRINSVLRVVNSALAEVGSPRLTALADGTPVSDLCDREYATTRDRVFYECACNEIVRRIRLVNAENTAPAFGFAKAFVLPDDFIRLLRFDDPSFRFRIENGQVLTDQTSLNMIYVFRNEDVTTWGPGLMDAVVLRLASRLAKPITGSDDLSFKMFDKSRDSIAELRYQDAQQGPTDYYAGSTWDNSRLGGSVEFRPITATE